MKKKKKAPQSLKDKEKAKHIKLVRTVLENIGFSRIAGVDHKNFTFMDREGELDDAFFYENILLLLEYTTESPPGDHLKKKLILFQRINDNKIDFLKFIKQEPVLHSLITAIASMEEKYTLQGIQIRIVYISRYELNNEDKKLAPYVCYFDYEIVKYFEIIAKAIKKSTRYEFFNFLQVPYNKIGDEINNSAEVEQRTFIGEILPESKSFNIEGIKIVTFYIDAISLLERAYVMRNDSWHNEENIELFQRLLIPKKIRQMREYLVKKQGVFVNNIVVALSSDDIKLEDQEGNLLEINDDGTIKNVLVKTVPAKITIVNKPNIIGIIDGQHRVFAYHEGNDIFEEKISRLRRSQNLLVSGILLPKKWSLKEKLRFQATLFLEINTNQQGADSQLKQSIDSMLSPYSSTSISKHIIEKLNQSGPLANMFAMKLSDEHKIKTASIVSFALNILVRPNNQDGLWHIWGADRKDELLKDVVDDNLLKEYQDFCVEKIRDFLIAVKDSLSTEQWNFASPNSQGILNVTSINGMLNCIRELIAHDKVSDVAIYRKKLEHLSTFNFKEYKSSQYKKLGVALYNQFWGRDIKDTEE